MIIRTANKLSLFFHISLLSSFKREQILNGEFRCSRIDYGRIRRFTKRPECGHPWTWVRHEPVRARFEHFFDLWEVFRLRRKRSWTVQWPIQRLSAKQEGLPAKTTEAGVALAKVRLFWGKEAEPHSISLWATIKPQTCQIYWIIGDVASWAAELPGRCGSWIFNKSRFWFFSFLKTKSIRKRITMGSTRLWTRWIRGEISPRSRKKPRKQQDCRSPLLKWWIG